MNPHRKPRDAAVIICSLLFAFPWRSARSNRARGEGGPPMGYFVRRKGYWAASSKSFCTMHAPCRCRK